ncbi:hypothetical protein SBV1_2350001 [Verrucomicrobia bacterium]|nr:hypothetical protein SBV1_2350001 [Verrucomicrobiota bacterium]
MKLLFDQNLSFRLCQALADLFPGSSLRTTPASTATPVRQRTTEAWAYPGTSASFTRSKSCGSTPSWCHARCTVESVSARHVLD